MNSHVKKKSYYKKALEIATIIIPILYFVGTIASAYLAYKLVPLADSINSVAQKADAFYSVHSNDVSRNEFTLLEQQISEIQQQVNIIYKTIK